VRSLENNSFRFIKDNFLRTTIITVVLIILSLSIIYFDTTRKTFSDNRATIRDLILTIASTIASPAVLIEEGLYSIREINNLYDELKDYKEEQSLSSDIFQELSVLRQKVEIYENDLNFIKDNEFKSITVEIFADTSNRYFSSILLKAGKSSGVSENNTIVSSQGLVGRVTEIGNKVSRGLLLSDISSRVPVSISSSEIQGILIGQNLNRPKINYIKNLNDIKVGDLVVTSGKGGIFPSNLVVGSVAILDKKNQHIEVDLIVNPKTLSRVRIINYQIENRVE
jgi:rod shape-determining protein MreC